MRRNLTIPSVPVWLLIALLALVVSACSPTEAPAAPDAPAAEATTAPAEEEAAEDTEDTADDMADDETADEAPASAGRTGAMVDEVIVVEEPSAAAAVTRLDVGELDVYAFAVSDAEVAAVVDASSTVDSYSSYGSNSELTFNPSGPVFEGTGKLNPFAVARIREAMNMLIDRNYVAQELYGGMARPRTLAITGAFPDYARLVDVVRQLEIEYGHNPEAAAEIITEEMEALGAELVDGTWQYEGEAVEIIILIRTEDARLAVGDYVAGLLEDLGFVVTRDYRTAAEASPIWIQGDPNDGQFHIYTGGWVTTVISRDQATNFNFYYTSRGLAFPLWQNYTPSEEFDEIANRLGQNDFATMEERADLFAQALRLSMEDSVRIWLIDQLSISPKRAEVSVAADLAGGIYGAWLWPHTLQRDGEVGGSMTIGMPSILPEPWNPLNGSNWIYDQMVIRGTGDAGTLPDPYTGLSWPQRIERAEVSIVEGLPVAATHDWVDLEFVEENAVPGDAWVDWDATEQRFITVDEKFPDGLTANRKSVVYYPEGLYDTLWHDGSNFSIADIVMGMILTFDRAKPESAVYDESQVPPFETFLEPFRGVRIVQEDPLIIETYSDLYFLDAEQNVSDWYPYYAQGPGAWHTLGLGLETEANGELAFSSAKADQMEVEWLSMIAGPSIEVLARQLEAASAEAFVPYAATLGDFLTEEEAASRWSNLQSWYDDKGHFWVGNGVFYIEAAFPVEGTVQLVRNENFTDDSAKWAGFGTPMIAQVELVGPGPVNIGSEAIFDVFVDFNDEPYEADLVSEVKYLVFDAVGELAFTGNAELVDDGYWEIILDAEQTAELEAGSNRMEVAVVPMLVSIPSFDSVEFVTVP
ncbi:MAG: ABC transporter substrate-binding protein [Litorilinea sp.]